MAVKLHELHLRRLEATVNLVEAALGRMEHLLQQTAPVGIVRSVENTISETQRAELLESLRRLRGELTRFAKQFSLGRHAMDVRQLLNAELSSCWVMLENCRPKRMKGYGQVFEETARKALEESVGKLLDEVLALRAGLQ